jgi:transposase-like protein
MSCPHCQSTAITKRPGCTELGYRRFRCRTCKREFNERTGTPFNDTRAIRNVIGDHATHRPNRYLNTRLEQDHQGITQWCRPLCGLNRLATAARLCRLFDEMRALFRLQLRHNQGLSLHQRRCIHRARFAELMGIMAVA